MILLNKKYCSESLFDLSRDVDEAIEETPCEFDDSGFQEGEWTVTITYKK